MENLTAEQWRERDARVRAAITAAGGNADDWCDHQDGYCDHRDDTVDWLREELNRLQARIATLENQTTAFPDALADALDWLLEEGGQIYALWEQGMLGLYDDDNGMTWADVVNTLKGGGVGTAAANGLGGDDEGLVVAERFWRLQRALDRRTT